MHNSKNETINCFRSTIEEILAKFLYDGPVAKPQQYSAWYRMKKSYFERELKMICEMNELKKEECSYIIKRWVRKHFNP